MQRSDWWTGDGKLTVIKCLARWSEQWVQLIHSRRRQSRFGLGALDGWIGGLGTGLDVWVAGSDVSVAGLELAVAGYGSDGAFLVCSLSLLCFSSLVLSVLLCVESDPKMNWSENESVNSFPGQRGKFWSIGIQFSENCIFRCNQTCEKGWKWFPEIIFTQNKRTLRWASLCTTKQVTFVALVCDE